MQVSFTKWWAIDIIAILFIVMVLLHREYRDRELPNDRLFIIITATSICNDMPQY